MNLLGTKPPHRAVNLAALSGVFVAIGTAATMADFDRDGRAVAQLARAVPAVVQPAAWPPPKPDVKVTVGTTTGARPVPPGFVGLSIEYPSLLWYAGPDPSHLNPLFERLLRYVSPGAGKQIRIGGRTTDWTWWPIPGQARPPGISYDLTPTWIATARALADQLAIRFTLGINLEAASPTIAGAESQALLDGIGRQAVRELEIGNEPNWYSKFAWYRDAHRHRVLGRPPGYGLSDFTAQFSDVAGAISPVPLAGPSVGSTPWLHGLAGFIARERSLAEVTVHRYPLNRCQTPPWSPAAATLHNLLQPRSTTGLAATIARYVAIAHRSGVGFRIDELGSVACGGKRGLSDTFASALWALDALFAMDRAGVDGVNFHTFRGAAYAPYEFRRAGDRWSAVVRPQYYGMLMFARAAPAGSQLLLVRSATVARTMAVGRAPTRRAGTKMRRGRQVRVSAGIAHALPAALRIWAVRAPDGRTRVVLINMDPRHGHVASVAVPQSVAAAGASTPGMLTRLLAPSLRSRHGVTLGGQSFGTISSTAELAGPPRLTRVRPYNGRYVVTLPPASAAMLVVG